MIITAVYDKKAKYYDFITSYVNAQTAIRQFEQACLDSQSILSKYPDFDLYQIGSVDHSSGVITSCNVLLRSNSDLIGREPGLTPVNSFAKEGE